MSRRKTNKDDTETSSSSSDSESEYEEEKPVKSGDDVKSLSPSNLRRRRPATPIRVPSPHILSMEEPTSEENNDDKQSPKQNSIQHQTPTVHNVSDIVERTVIQSPLIRKNYSDISENDRIEQVLNNYCYHSLFLIEKKVIGQDKKKTEMIPEYVVCIDPAGAKVYIDITDTKDYNIGTNSIKIISATESDRSKITIETSVINFYEDLVKNTIYGIAIESGNKMTTIRQKDDGEKVINYYEIDSSKTKNSNEFAFPIIKFTDIIADSDSYDISIVDIVYSTNVDNNKIFKEKDENVSRLMNRAKKLMEEQKDKLLHLYDTYKSTVNNVRKRREKHVSTCLDIYDKYDHVEEGIQSDELEIFDRTRFSSYMMGDGLAKIQNIILSFGCIEKKISELSTEIDSIEDAIKNMSESINNISKEKNLKNIES